MSRTLSARQVLQMKFETVRLGGGWDDCIGEVETSGIWFIWGNSGNGKTSAVVSLCKELSTYGKVLYNSREEGVSLTMQNTLRRFGMDEVGSRFQICNLPIDELEQKISQPRGPRFIVIDSIQYMGLTYRDIRRFCEKYPTKLIIFVSRVNGRQPEGRAATAVMYDAALKIWVEGYKAFSKGRFIGPTGQLTIWREGAVKYWEGKETR